MVNSDIVSPLGIVIALKKKTVCHFIVLFVTMNNVTQIIRTKIIENVLK